jgi:HK97 family phage major capsid protein
MDTLTVLPFLLVLVVAVAAMPTDVVQVNAWGLGHEHTLPWKSRASSALNLKAAVSWFARLWRSRTARWSLLMAIALLAVHLGVDDGSAVGLAVVADSPTLADVKAAIEASNDALKKYKGDQDALVQSVAELQSKMNKLKFSSAGAPASAVPIQLPSLREYHELQHKAQSIGSDPGGGYVVFTENGPFFDRLRPSTVILQAGPVVVDMQSDKMDMPGVGASTTVSRLGEGSTLSESDLTLGKVSLIARKYSVRTVASREWLDDANVDARRLVADDHARQLGAAVDLDMLEGNTGSHIIGLRRIAGVTKTELGAGNGATPALDDIANLLYRLENANVDKSRLALFMAVRTWNTVAKLKDSQNRYQLAPDPTTESRRQLFGIPVFVSSQIAVAETVGTSTDCSYIIGADMSKVVVGRRGTPFVLYDPFSKSGTDQIVIQTLSRWDMNVLQTAAVEVLTGVRP